MDALDFKEILVRKPFFQITAERPPADVIVTDRNNTIDNEFDKATYKVLTQEEMMRQYYPSGHKINNPVLFPDIWKQDPETKKWYCQKITRTAFAFQQIITTKHLIHIVGNDMQFELSEEEQRNSETERKQRELANKAKNGDDVVIETTQDESVIKLLEFKNGWLKMGMEVHVCDAVLSYLATAEAAIVFYQDKGVPGARALSYLNGDTLYPHYDSITGELDIFARKYYDYDEDGKAITEWVEVWDDTFFYRAKRGTAESSIVNKIKDKFGINGYNIIEKKRHGYNIVPVKYVRNEDGPCWINAQITVEQFEEAMAYFFENNKAFAFPIMVLQGDGVNVIGDNNGAAKVIEIEGDGNAKFLDNNDVSASYNTLLTKFYDLIYEQSFTVKPPELKSGDLPGVALKLLYSPAIERAIQDAHKLQPFIDGLVYLVKYGWGFHKNMLADMLALGINAWIEPYVHQNDTELTTNLATAVQNNFLSTQTASERYSKYAKNDEYSRIVRQMKEKMLLDVEKANLQTTHNTDEEIRKAKASQTSGQDINTGGGGHINQTDENGNRPGENNWDEFNKNRF